MKARCECLLPLPHGPPNPCQILPKMVPNRRGGTPWRALSAPKRPKGTQERSKRPPETAKKRLQERLGALLRRFGRVLSAIWASRRSLCGNADFLKSMLSPRREHRFWGPEGPDMDTTTVPKGSCAAQQASGERHSASDDVHGALSEAQVAPTSVRVPQFRDWFRYWFVTRCRRRSR